MKKYQLKGGRLSVTESAVFEEASREELRVLLALIERGFDFADEDELAKVARVTRARASSTLTLLLGEGIIEEYDSNEPKITYEFDPEASHEREEQSKKVAASIRDNSLSSMIDACTKLLGKTTLPTTEIKKLASLNTSLELSEEYVVALASYLLERDALSVTRLVSTASRLVDDGITTATTLTAYLEGKRREDSYTASMRSIFGIWGRNLSPTELKYFKKWQSEFSFTSDIVEYAYGIATESIAKLDYKYINAILTRWHEAGCKTIDEILEYEKHSKAEKENKKSAGHRPRPKAEAEAPKYGNFDPREALAAALSRSYGDDNDK